MAIIYRSRQLQILLAIEHEFSHLSCDKKNHSTRFIRSTLKSAIDKFNKEAEYINSIDISALHKYLDNIDKSVIDHNNFYQAIKYSVDLATIVMYYGDLAVFPDNKRNNDALRYACDNYIHGKTSDTLDVEEYVTECTCDLIALTTHLQLEQEGEPQESIRKQVIEAYILVLLLEDIVELTKESCKLDSSRQYKPVDNIYMRRVIVRSVLPLMLVTFLKLTDKEVNDLVECFDKASDSFDYLYAKYCEIIYGIDLSHLRNNIVLLGSKEWEQYYMEIIKNLSIPM